MPRTHRTCTLLFAVALLGLACGPEQTPDRSVVNHELGIRIAALPKDLKVVTNQGATLQLAPVADGAGSTISFQVGPEDPAPNLVAMLQGDRMRIEELPEGQYQGGQELVTPSGTAFYSRGRYLDGGSPVEETRVFGIHPKGDRVLKLSYRYPAADDSARRVTRLLDLYAQIEAAPVSE